MSGGTPLTLSELKRALDDKFDQFNKTFKSEDVLVSPISRAAAQLEQFNTILRDTGKSGFAGFIKDNQAAIKGFMDANQAAMTQSLKLYGTLDSSKETMKALRDETEAFVLMTADFQSAMANAVTTMQGVGFEASSLAKIIDSSAMAFGKSGAEIKKVLSTISNVSQQLAINPKRIAEDFMFAQKNFAYTSKKFMENFIDLQKMSRNTGVAFTDLASSFGSSLDTFEGSAQMAGKLNALLGTSMFNSIDLLNKTEAERAKVVRDGILNRFGGQAQNLRKFELISISKALNMDVETTRKFLRTGNSDVFEKKLTDFTKDKSPIKLQEQNLNDELNDLVQVINRSQDPLERALIGLGDALENSTKNISLEFLRRLGADDIADALKDKDLKTGQLGSILAKSLVAGKAPSIDASGFARGYNDKNQSSPLELFLRDSKLSMDDAVILFGGDALLNKLASAAGAPPSLINPAKIFLMNQFFGDESFRRTASDTLGNLKRQSKRITAEAIPANLQSVANQRRATITKNITAGGSSSGTGTTSGSSADSTIISKTASFVMNVNKVQFMKAAGPLLKEALEKAR